MKRVGIIAGTKIDTKFGISFFSKHFEVKGYPISADPQEQTRMQALGREKLTAKVQSSIESAKYDGAESIVIYCNSLSGAIDLRWLRNRNRMKIITPLDMYERIADKHNVFGLLAANCQSTANIERLILSINKNAVVIGCGNLNIVNEIERGVGPLEIIKTHKLVELSRILSGSGAEKLILGCTHFSFFYDELKRLTDIELIEPSEEMARMV